MNLFPRLNEHGSPRGRATRGFTLVELMMTLTILALVISVLMVTLLRVQRNKVGVTNRLESSQAARVAVDLMASDLRSAGYGAEINDPVLPQPPIAYIDSTQVLINANLAGDVGTLDTLAYDPAGFPRPKPLDGTPWTPPKKYKSRAEVIRWTLDANNDGQVDADDQSDPDGADAQLTRNPNDYALLRQVFADSTNDVAGNNGGGAERVALVQRPGNGKPAMFTVYMKGSATPWDWSSGPVPANQLANIERVGISVVAPSGKPDANGAYTQTTYSALVNATRNVPKFGAPEYPVDGYVYWDQNKNHVKDGTEVGIEGSTVQMGVLSTVTNMSGYFLFRAPAGTYTLKHTPATGFGKFNSPDSFLVSIGPGLTRSFSDTVKAGGWVTASVYNDLNGSGVKDAGETWRSEVQVDLVPGPQHLYTDSLGNAKLFAPTGGYTVTVTPPDSYLVTTPNPVSGTMVNGGTASILFGVKLGGNGIIKGTVYRDLNRNGVQDAGETGIQNAFVTVTPDGGVNTLAFGYTDVNGLYTITSPMNDPPHTTGLTIAVTVPNGFYPTTTTAIMGVWLQAGQTITGQNFGMGTYQTITLNASRVLSLISGDMLEKDNAAKDADLVLGADAAGTDNISVWFNGYNASPLFTPDPTYTRLAPQSVMAMALDTLDSGAPKACPDLVTGTKYTPSGNVFVWFNQTSSGNEGFFPASYSTNQNYRTQDNGDVQSLLTFDCAGGNALDLIVGTKSPTAGQGTIEVWQSDNATTPTFSRVEVYPPAGSIPGNALGEVTAMALGDIDGDGRKDLIVGTRTGSYSGQLLVFRNVSKVTGARFVLTASYDLGDEAVTSLVCTDVDRDGQIDVVIGSQTSLSSGRVEFWRNKNQVGDQLKLERSVDAPGIVLSVVCGDLGGANNNDIAIGYRTDTSSYAGGVRIYYTDTGSLPASGSDPSGGAVTNMVPALNVNNFNYGVYPSTPSPPYLLDLSVGVKSGPSTGALVVIIR